MNKKYIIALFPDYLDGLLDESRKKEVEAHLKDCSSCTKELEALKTLLKAIEDDHVDVPSERMRADFHKQIALEKKSLNQVISIDAEPTSGKSSWASPYLKIAASVVLLIGAFLMGKYQSENKSNREITSLTKEKLEFKQTAMLSLLKNESASKRIQGLNAIETFENLDETIVKALIDRMRYDENTNVRLAAVEALSKFTGSESVKSAFIKALGTEKNPSVQIAIIQILVKIQESKAVAPMKRLLEKEGTQPFIKKEITQVLSEQLL